MTLAKTKKCEVSGCKKTRAKKDRFCHFHRPKVTLDRFIGALYSNMNQRVKGKHTRSPHLYKGRSILPREVFKIWARNHVVFLQLYKQWKSCGYDISLTPSVNRINPNSGYTLDNMEWVTFSQNCSMAGATRKMNERKVAYNILGIRGAK